MDWLLLVEESVVNIGIPLDMLVLFKHFQRLVCMIFFGLLGLFHTAYCV